MTGLFSYSTLNLPYGSGNESSPDDLASTRFAVSPPSARRFCNSPSTAVSPSVSRMRVGFSKSASSLQQMTRSVRSPSVSGTSSWNGFTATVLIPSPIGSIHSFGMPERPRRMPSTAPQVAPVQSVSSPQLTAVQIDLPKSPRPQSSPTTVKATLAGAWNQPRSALSSTIRLRAVFQS